MTEIILLNALLCLLLCCPCENAASPRSTTRGPIQGANQGHKGKPKSDMSPRKMSNQSEPIPADMDRSSMEDSESREAMDKKNMEKYGPATMKNCSKNAMDSAKKQMGRFMQGGRDGMTNGRNSTMMPEPPMMNAKGEIMNGAEVAMNCSANDTENARKEKGTTGMSKDKDPSMMRNKGGVSSTPRSKGN